MNSRKLFFTPCPCGRPYFAKGLCKRCYGRMDYQRHLEKRRLSSRINRKKYYYQDVEKYRTESRNQKAEQRSKWRDFLWNFKSNPCTDCRNSFPHFVMELDHTRGEKSFGVTISASGRPWKVLMEELAKCDLVCANCHRRRTWERGQSRRSRKAA